MVYLAMLPLMTKRLAKQQTAMPNRRLVVLRLLTDEHKRLSINRPLRASV